MLNGHATRRQRCPDGFRLCGRSLVGATWAANAAVAKVGHVAELRTAAVVDRLSYGASTGSNRRQVSPVTTGRHWPRHAQRDAVSSHSGGVASSRLAITVRIGNRTGDRSICAIVRILTAQI